MMKTLLISLLLLSLSTGAVFAANKYELIVTTETGKLNNASTDSRVYLRINAEDKRYHLDTPNKNDLEVGATDVFRGIYLDMDPKDIDFMTLEFEGEDAWFLEKIHFEVVKGTQKSKKLSFKKKKWMSSVRESVRSKEKIKFKIDGKLQVTKAGN